MTERPIERARPLAQEHMGGLVGLLDDVVGADTEHAQPQLVGESATGPRSPHPRAEDRCVARMPAVSGARTRVASGTFTVR